MLNRKQKQLKAFWMTVLATVIFGTNAVSIRVATESMDPIAFSALRSLAAGAILLLFVKNFHFLKKPKILLRLIFGAAIILFSMAFYTMGVSMSGALKASIFSLTTPLFVYFLSLLLLHEPVIKRILAGSIIGLIGGGLIVGLQIVFGQKFEMGDLLLLAAYFLIAAGNVHAKYMFKWLTPNELTSTRFFMAGVGLLGFVIITGNAHTLAEGEPIAWLMLLFSIVVTGVIATTILHRALKHIKSEQSAPIFYIEPMVGAFLAAILLHETLDIYSIIGSIIIIIGVAISHPHHHRLYWHYHIPKPRKTSTALSIRLARILKKSSK